MHSGQSALSMMSPRPAFLNVSLPKVHLLEVPLDITGDDATARYFSQKMMQLLGTSLQWCVLAGRCGVIDALGRWHTHLQVMGGN